MDLPLDQAVRAALGERKGDWPLIAEQTGVSHSWLSQFFRGRIQNPGYATLTKLATHLLTKAAA